MLKTYYFSLIFTLISITLLFGQKSIDLNGYSSVSQINDIVEREGSLWVATPGGLIQYIKSSKEQYIFRDLTDMPDINIVTLALDSSGYIWAGSEKGYLYRVDKNNRIRKSSDYFSKGWDINDLVIYDDYLLVGSDQGFSLYDITEMKVNQNSTKIGTFSSPTVNVIKHIKGSLKENDSIVVIDRIYIGVSGGYAWYDNIYDDLGKENFYNSTIWKEAKDTVISALNIEKYKDSLIISKEPVIVSGDSLFYVNKKAVFLNDKKVKEFASEPISLFVNNNALYVGTLWDFFYEITDKSQDRIVLNGIRFMNTNRVYITSDSVLWIMPNTAQNHNRTPNIGVTKMQGGKWDFFEPGQNNFGVLADWNESFGITEDKNGDMWFGFSGEGVKKYNTKEKKWYKYQIASEKFPKSEFLFLEGERIEWHKCDMIMSDINGFIWMSTWKSPNVGSVLCFDPNIVYPSEGDYKYFFPESGNHYIENTLAMSQDSCGNVILGGYWGDLVMFTYSGNPIKDGVNEPFFNYANQTGKNLTKVYDIASAPDSTTWVASANGFFLYSNAYNEVLDSRSFTGIPFNGNINSVEVGEFYRIFDTSFVTLWCSSESEGIIKSTVSYIRDEDGTISNLDIVEDSVTSYNEENGLITNVVNQIYLDRKTGYVWAATNSGVISIFDGNPYTERKDSRKISAFPNPYIRKAHKRITFQHLAPEAQVMIYTLDGKLIANLNEDNSEMIKTGKEWTYYWTPSDKIKPGTYIYTATTRKDEGYGKLMILP